MSASANHAMAEGEVPFKQWLAEEAERSGLSVSAVYNRLSRDKPKWYPNVRLRRVNARTVFVREVGA